MRRAYLVIWINTESLVVEAAGIYSEPTPSAMRRVFPVSLWDHEAEDYGKASDYIRESIRSGDAYEFHWLRGLLGLSDESEIRALQRTVAQLESRIDQLERRIDGTCANEFHHPCRGNNPKTGAPWSMALWCSSCVRAGRAL